MNQFLLVREIIIAWQWRSVNTNSSNYSVRGKYVFQDNQLLALNTLK